MAGSVNKVTLLGRLTRDPELRYTPSGSGVCNFAIATDRYVGKDEQGQAKRAADFHNCVVWNMGQRKLADLCAQYLKKGRLVYVEGRLQTRSWDDAATGKKAYRTEVVVNDVQFIDSNRDGAGNGGAPSADDTAEAAAALMGGEPPLDPDDIPF